MQPRFPVATTSTQNHTQNIAPYHVPFTVVISPEIQDIKSSLKDYMNGEALSFAVPVKTGSPAVPTLRKLHNWNMVRG